MISYDEIQIQRCRTEKHMYLNKDIILTYDLKRDILCNRPF